MRTLLFIGLLCSAAFGSGPKHDFKDPLLNDEMQNIYKDIGKIPQLVDVYSFTKAQIQGLTPKRPGRLYYCSDCTTDAVVVSTGTTIGAFGRLTARTTAIN